MSDSVDHPRILAFDADPLIRDAFARILRLAGYDLTICDQQSLLFSGLATKAFHLAICDNSDPATLGDIRAAHPDLPIVELRDKPSGFPDPAPLPLVRSLVKPFTSDALLEAIGAALSVPESVVSSEIIIRDDAGGDGWVEITAPNRREYLDRFQAFCERLVDTRLSAKARDELKIAVRELGQNAIEWGNRSDDALKIRMAYRLLDDRIHIRIADEGQGFDPGQIPDPTIDPVATIQAREAKGKRPGGFGIHLARRVMDRLAYNERGNVVVLEKRFRDPSP